MKKMQKIVKTNNNKKKKKENNNKMMMIMKIKKMNQAGKRRVLIICPPAPDHQDIELEVLKIPNFCCLFSRCSQGSIEPYFYSVSC